MGLDVKSDARTSKSQVCVTLERSQEDQIATYSGKAEVDGTEISLLFGIARATCLAVNLTIEPPNAFFVDDVTLISVGHKQAVAVLVGLVTPRRNYEELLGAALVRREVREACVRATLDALNRRLEVLPRKGSLTKGARSDVYKRQVYFYGRTGGAVPLPRNIEKRVLEMVSGKEPVVTDYFEKAQGGGG